jgi:hypothetical protein
MAINSPVAPGFRYLGRTSRASIGVLLDMAFPCSIRHLADATTLCTQPVSRFRHLETDRSQVSSVTVVQRRLKVVLSLEIVHQVTQLLVTSRCRQHFLE